MLNDMNSKKETSAAFQNPYSPPQLAQQQLPIKYIAAAIAMAIFGWILGKFVLWIDRGATTDTAGINHQWNRVMKEKQNENSNNKKTKKKQKKRYHKKSIKKTTTINDYFK